MAKKKDNYKTFISKPIAITDTDGTILNKDKELALLAKDVSLVTNIAEKYVTETMLHLYLHAKEEVSQLSEIGKLMGIHISEKEKTKHFSYLKNKKISGFSRLNRMVCDRAVRELSSWDERVSAKLGNSSKHMSQGWKRTINANKPGKLSPKMSLSATDKLYAEIINITNDSFELRMVIAGQWRVLVFNFDNKRFQDAYKITKPDIILNKNGYPVFCFTAAFAVQYAEFSNQYVIGIDVGINDYATVSVIDINRNRTVETTSLSQRVHSLHNKVSKANKQVSSLQKKGDKDEARLHREANSRRKKELAIVAGQEIAELALNYDNAIVVFEDLSWITNTMNNGRWNRGALVKWSQHFVELNGGRVTHVNAAYTSTKCSDCGNTLIDYKSSYLFKECFNCNKVWNRDVNASINVAKKFYDKGTYDKYVSTRSKAKNLVKTPKKRSGNGLPTPLKYPAINRAKHAPTPKQVKQRRLNRIAIIREVNKVKSDNGSVSVNRGNRKLRSVLTDCSKGRMVTLCSHESFSQDKNNISKYNLT